MASYKVGGQPRCRADAANYHSFSSPLVAADQIYWNEVEYRKRDLVSRDGIQESNQDIQEDCHENQESLRLMV